jgi:hypothetical protein
MFFPILISYVFVSILISYVYLFFILLQHKILLLQEHASTCARSPSEHKHVGISMYICVHPSNMCANVRMCPRNARIPPTHLCAPSVHACPQRAGVPLA